MKTSHLRGWLRKVTVNTARSWLRRQKLSVVSAEDWLALPDEQAESLEELAERRILAERALSLLDGQTRELFVRYYARRETVTEIAAAMQMKPSTVKSRLQRGRDKLKQALEKGE